MVDVHQVVRDKAGAVLADEHVGHRFTLKHSLIQAMEVQGATSAPEALQANIFARSQISKKFLLVDKNISRGKRVPSCDKKEGSC